ncbi:hypothetical protein [Facklamia sp. P12932]|uniref:hypothetical protein n=1 Tax=Facklamia sp. P12932 TaxID=3421947 RepID=UPI003D183189
MLKLNFITDNPRWGKSGILFKDVMEYSKTLGFLTNIRHYKGYGENKTNFDNSISIHIEGNHTDGAWAKECRIHGYKTIDIFTEELEVFNRAKSAGVRNIEFRINSNPYINHLIEEYKFKVENSEEYISNITPSSYLKIKNIFLKNIDFYSDKEKEELIQQFKYGFNL